MSLLMEYPNAPEIEASGWLNAEGAMSLANLKGSVVVIHAFQMLCPGCVSNGIPQTKRIAATFPESEVKVIGLHSVFEHHSVMTPDALKAFIHEYKITFPVAIDKPSSTDHIPMTMQRYNMRGTPTLILIDKNGKLRLNHFGLMEDMQVGNMISQLVSETASTYYSSDKAASAKVVSAEEVAASQCTDTGCQV